MPNFCVVGGQWGDEGKGKIVDLLTRDFDPIIRYQGVARGRSDWGREMEEDPTPCSINI